MLRGKNFFINILSKSTIYYFLRNNIDLKSEVIAIIKEMQDDSTIEDIMEELYFKAQVDAGLNQLDNGNFISHEEVKQRLIYERIK